MAQSVEDRERLNMPDINFECPKCKQMFDAPEEYAAQLIDCPTCKQMIEVPIRSSRIDLLQSPMPAPKSIPASKPSGRSKNWLVTLPLIKESGVSTALTVIACIEFLISPLAGFGVGQDNPEAGLVIFLSGLISGLILLGFARVVQNTYESSQRLERIEMLIERDFDYQMQNKLLTK